MNGSSVKKYMSLFLVCLIMIGFTANAQSTEESQIKQLMTKYGIAPNNVFFRASSASMEPTVTQDSLLVVEPYAQSESPQRGDIIMFLSPLETNVSFVKRVIGVGGDKIQFKQGVFFLNDKPQTENYLFPRDDAYIQAIIKNGEYRNVLYDSKELIVQQNTYFVAGDNRYLSKDSRFFGTIDATAIQGKALLWKNLSTDDDRRGAFLKANFERFATKLPLNLGDGVSLNSVDVVGNNKVKLIYNSYFRHLNKKERKYLNAVNIKGEMKPFLCNPRVLGGLTGVTIEQVFHFIDNAKELSFSFNSAECTAPQL